MSRRCEFCAIGYALSHLEMTDAHRPAAALDSDDDEPKASDERGRNPVMISP